MELVSLPRNIIFSDNLQADVRQVLAQNKHTQVIVLSDSNTSKYCLSRLSFLSGHHHIEIPAGEENKNLDTCVKVWSELTRLKADRKCLLVILGGGVAGDLGGFCAATYKRGIQFVLIPTTLLSQVDASVGGKLGIDFEEYKNHIGVFQEPIATIIHTPLLETLPRNELRSGFAEIIKHCLLSDKAMWNVVRSRPVAQQDWKELTRHSVLFKAGVVKLDPRESGLRKVLNFGHTIGHAIESFFLKSPQRLLHGEAIAIGMIAESWIAQQKGHLTQSEVAEIQRYIVDIFGVVKLPADTAPIVELTLQDKKNTGGTVQIAVPKGIGGHVWDVDVTLEDVAGGLQFYASIPS